MIRETERGFYHTLEQGEDIWLLAELYYGDASLWWVIYHQNLDVFGDDSECSFPGIEVFVPYVEVSEQRESLPDFLAQVAASPSFDPMVLLAQERYLDPWLCFDIYEFNGWEINHLPSKGTEIRYPAIASRPSIRRAERWRAMFYRE